MFNHYTFYIKHLIFQRHRHIWSWRGSKQYVALYFRGAFSARARGFRHDGDFCSEEYRWESLGAGLLVCFCVESGFEGDAAGLALFRVSSLFCDCGVCFNHGEFDE